MGMTELRAEIDRLDEEITDLVCLRMDLCGRIGGEKQRQGIPVLDAGREREILTRVGKRAGEPDVYKRQPWASPRPAPTQRSAWPRPPWPTRSAGATRSPW